MKKQRKVYNFDFSAGDYCFFRSTDGENNEFDMLESDWHEMDGPDTITVTVRPGDHLNK